MLLNSKGGERREGTAEVVEGRRWGKGGGALDRRERKRKKKKRKKKIQLLLWMGARFQFDS